MTLPNTDRTCGIEDPGHPISDLGYGPRECAILTIARGYFSSFASPERQGWTFAIYHAVNAFGEARGPDVAVAVLSVVQCMRQARTSVFRFNSHECRRCAAHVSGHEQMLMAAMRAAARGRMDAASGHATLLCEGSDVQKLLRALQLLAEKALPPGRSADGDQRDRIELRNPAPGVGL
ncbi:MAG: hypothetical protein AAGJ91_09005 [Pseudomonadota bacterium]